MSFPGSILLTQELIMTQTSTPRHPLGTRGYTKDGKAYRYARAGTVALSVALLMQQSVADASLDADQELCTSTLYAQSEFQSTDAVAIYVKPAATEVVVADFYKEGYLIFNDELGEGQMIEIGGHLALDGTISQIWKINFADDAMLHTTLSTATEVGLYENKYDRIIVRPDTARTGIALGITPRAITASYYFWLQTWGPAMCVVVLATTAGDVLTDDSLTGTGTAGAIHKIATSTSALAAGAGHPDLGKVIGNALGPVATTEYALFDLLLAP